MPHNWKLSRESRAVLVQSFFVLGYIFSAAENSYCCKLPPPLKATAVHPTAVAFIALDTAAVGPYRHICSAISVMLKLPRGKFQLPLTLTSFQTSFKNWGELKPTPSLLWVRYIFFTLCTTKDAIFFWNVYTSREYSYFTGKRSFGSQLELRLIFLSLTKFKLIMKSGMSLLDYNLTN